MGTSTLLKITEEEKDAIENDYDPIDAPPGPYNLRPGIPGAVLSWTNQTFKVDKEILINREDTLVLWGPGNGKVHHCPNPGQRKWICLLRSRLLHAAEKPLHIFGRRKPLHRQGQSEAFKRSETSFAHHLPSQVYYEGPGVKERAALLRGCNQIWGQLMKGEEHDKELFRRFYQEMARDIRRERRRIGGDFAVAHVVLHRENRDRIRQGIYHDNDYIKFLLWSEIFWVQTWSSSTCGCLQRREGGGFCRDTRGTLQQPTSWMWERSNL